MFDLFSTLKWTKIMSSIQSKIIAFFTTNTDLPQSLHLRADIGINNYFPTNYKNSETAFLKAYINKTIAFHYYQRQRFR
jgi:hypothetical protein